MVVCDKWVFLKIFEFVCCVACVVAKRVSDDDSTRLALLLQKFSREWSLLRSVTWDSLGGSFADAVYGGYVIITFGLLLGRMFREIPRGKRILEGFLLGIGFFLFLVLGGLEFAAIDSVPKNLIVHASVLGALSILVAALFLIDLLAPRQGTTARQSQTDVEALPPHKSPDPKAKLGDKTNGRLHKNMNGKVNGMTKEDPILFSQPKHGYTQFQDGGGWERDDIDKTKFGSYRNGAVKNGQDVFDAGNYVRLSDPIAEKPERPQSPDDLLDDTERKLYEKELTKFNEKFLRKYILDGEKEAKDSIKFPKIPIKEDYFPELQTPVFARVKSGMRPKSLYDDLTPAYDIHRSAKNVKDPLKYRSGTMPTLQQLEEYLRTQSGRETRKSREEQLPPALSMLFPMEAIEEARDSFESERAAGTPTDPGYVQYMANRWPDTPRRSQTRTPRHSPTE